MRASWLISMALATLSLAPAQAGPATPAPVCEPFPGLEQLWTRPETRFVVFGEMHGTEETPGLFGEAVCAASRDRPVVVALEAQPELLAGAVSAYLASDGGPAARAALLAADHWNMPLTDGRSSMAMFRLFERLRELKATGRRIDVTYLMGAKPRGPQGYTELRYASVLLDAATEHPDALVLVLVGNFHASKTPSGMAGGAIPAVGLLPKDAVISLDRTREGGSAWNCQGPKPDCMARSFEAKETPPRGVTLYGENRDGYDGRFSFGAPTTASPPAVAVKP